MIDETIAKIKRSAATEAASVAEHGVGPTHVMLSNTEAMELVAAMADEKSKREAAEKRESAWEAEEQKRAEEVSRLMHRECVLTQERDALRSYTVELFNLLNECSPEVSRLINHVPDLAPSQRLLHEIDAALAKGDDFLPDDCESEINSQPPNADWLRRKLAQTEGLDEPAAGGGQLPTPSCLCCGHPGKAAVRMIDHPEIFVCVECKRATECVHQVGQVEVERGKAVGLNIALREAEKVIAAALESAHPAAVLARYRPFPGPDDSRHAIDSQASKENSQPAVKCNHPAHDVCIYCDTGYAAANRGMR